MASVETKMFIHAQSVDAWQFGLSCTAMDKSFMVANTFHSLELVVRNDFRTILFPSCLKRMYTQGLGGLTVLVLFHYGIVKKPEYKF